MYFSDPVHNIAQFGLKVGDHVADLGAGTGHHTLEMAKLVEMPGKVYAVDVQGDLLKELVSRARNEHLVNIIPVVADIEREHGTGISEGALDAALIANALFQVEDKFAFLKEAFRILRDGGELLVIDWSESFGGMGPSEKYVISEDSLMEIAEEVGFEYNRSIGAGEHHYGLIFRKPA